MEPRTIGSHFPSDRELVREVVLCARWQRPWFWYRDVLCEAERRGLLRITTHTPDRPFWWRPFKASIEVVDAGLLKALSQKEAA